MGKEVVGEGVGSWRTEGTGVGMLGEVGGTLDGRNVVGGGVCWFGLEGSCGGVGVGIGVLVGGVGDIVGGGVGGGIGDRVGDRVGKGVGVSEGTGVGDRVGSPEGTGVEGRVKTGVTVGDRDTAVIEDSVGEGNGEGNGMGVVVGWEIGSEVAFSGASVILKVGNTIG